MTASRHLRPLLAGLALAALAACVPGPPADVSGQPVRFREDYSNARAALESGRHDQAAAHYARLLDHAGPLEPRIRLEYAHALLRGGRMAEASQNARRVALAQTGMLRSAALAVQGTAEHELALAALARNAGKAEVTGHLAAAETALADALSKHGGMDPTGGLQRRLEEIRRTRQSL